MPLRRVRVIGKWYYTGGFVCGWSCITVLYSFGHGRFEREPKKEAEYGHRVAAKAQEGKVSGTHTHGRPGYPCKCSPKQQLGVQNWEPIQGTLPTLSSKQSARQWFGLEKKI